MLSLLFLILAFAAFLMVVVDAFKDEWWKGLLAFFTFFYWFYYAFVEFEHDFKWPIIIMAIAGGVLGRVL